MSLINTEIKPFVGKAFHQRRFIDVTKETLKGKWSVLFFYPANFSVVCPTELEDLADNYERFQKIGVEIFSISTDSHYAHKAWRDASHAVSKVNYVMVGDPTGQICRNFDVLVEETGMADRATFVIDPQCRVQLIEMTAYGIGRSAHSLLRKIKAAQYIAMHPEEVCPAEWDEGAKTLMATLDLAGKI